MIGPFRLAWRYITYHKFKTIVLIACITLTTSLPCALAIMLSRFNHQIVARADSTPLVVGAKGSRLDLTLHALYFTAKGTEMIKYGETDNVRADRLAAAIPLHCEFSARKSPLVGTSLEYFEFRQLHLASGRQITRLGDCVLGANVARRLNKGPGDWISLRRPGAPQRQF